jgi:phospholipase C
VSFFGDGPRIPLLLVSPYARSGAVDHTYTDHVSVLKFIERNWGLTNLSEQSLDHLPNPVSGANPYIPENKPAIGDLFDLFSFGAPQANGSPVVASSHGRRTTAAVARVPEQLR